MYSLLLDIFWAVILVDIFAIVFTLIFIINARINLRRQIANHRFMVDVVKAANKADSSASAAGMLNIEPEEFAGYCKAKGVDTPEERIGKREKLEKIRKEEEQKILSDEARWRAEKEKEEKEELKNQEEAAKKRKEQLSRFGFNR